MRIYWNKEVLSERIGLMKPNIEKEVKKMNKGKMNKNEKTARQTSVYKGVGHGENTTEEYV